MINFLKDFPKKFSLKTGEEIIVRPMEKGDKKSLLGFFRNLPGDDRLYLRDDVAKEETVDKWVKNLNYKKVLPLLAIFKDKVIADGTLHTSEYSWESHVGEIRLVVHPSFRNKGVGKILARELYIYAMKKGVEKIIARMMENQEKAIYIFRMLGFEKEAVLKDHAKDAKGKTHNMVIMSNNVRKLFEKLESLEDVFTRPAEGV